MKNILLILFLLISFILSCESADYEILDTKSGVKISIDQLVESLLQYQVIFFGEYHEDKLLHKLELELLIKLFNLNRGIAVSMEMFERDVQDSMDDYLSGKITEQDFLQISRPWSNYVTDYRPMIEFSKENGIDVIAANIPRSYAALIHRNGMTALDSLSTEEKSFVAAEHVVLEDEYKEIFVATMQQNMNHRPDSPMAKMMNFDLIYAAQCIKDDTMAESIRNYISKETDAKVIHYNGDFHSRKHLGTAQKLSLLEPEVKIAVIAPLILLEEETYDNSDLQDADYLILINK